MERRCGCPQLPSIMNIPSFPQWAQADQTSIARRAVQQHDRSPSIRKDYPSQIIPTFPNLRHQRHRCRSTSLEGIPNLGCKKKKNPSDNEAGSSSGKSVHRIHGPKVEFQLTSSPDLWNYLIFPSSVHYATCF